MRTLSLKVDVCTHEGLHRGVPNLLDAFRRLGVRATFFLTMGPDNSGKALRNVFRPGFLSKMARTRAASTYGWRTLVSGTLLPARPTAARAPDLVRRIAGEGHELAIHGWDHRLWQDRLARLDPVAIRDQLRQAIDALSEIVGTPPVGTGAPGWIVTADSLRIQDEFGLGFASDLRGGPACRLRIDGVELATPQIPTTGLCLEELLAGGMTDRADLAAALRAGIARSDAAVLPLHAELEGREYVRFLERRLPRIMDGHDAIEPLGVVSARLSTTDLSIRDLIEIELPGRSGAVASSAALAAGSTPAGQPAAQTTTRG